MFTRTKKQTKQQNPACTHFGADHQNKEKNTAFLVQIQTHSSRSCVAWNSKDVPIACQVADMQVITKPLNIKKYINNLKQKTLTFT